MKVAIADDSALVYSDDYRSGWVNGFRGIDCEVQVFDIGKLRRSQHRFARYRVATTVTGLGRMIATNIASWKPDLVWCHHGRAASDSSFILTLKKHGIPTAVYLCDEPYESGETALYSPMFDYVFSMDLCTLDLHRRAHDRPDRVFYLPPAADVGVFKQYPYFNKEEKLARAHKSFFLGNGDLIPRRDWLEPLERVLNNVDIRYFPHRQPMGRPVAKGQARWLDTREHPLLYSDCVVGLNVHRSPWITKKCFDERCRVRRIPLPRGMGLCQKMPEHEGTGFWNDANLPASHVNPRFFEMAACGTLVVSDASRPELARMFPMAPRADDPAHFIELVSYYMDHVDEAEEIGKRCSMLVSRRHSYQHRACEALIRAGFKESRAGNLPTFLGVPEDWLNPQDLNAREVILSSEQTGRLGRWSPQYGMSLILPSGDPSEAMSIDVPNQWS
jgi:spore maturation protein CgeB